MRNPLIALVILAGAATPAVAAESLDVTDYGIVYRVPGMDRVKVKKDLPFGDGLKLDLYLPAAARGPVPVVIFVNGVGDGGPRKVKDWKIYQDWPRLVAARGYAGIIAEARPGAVRESVSALFEHVSTQGKRLGIDPERVAVWSCSANVSTALPLVMEGSPRGLRAVVTYYGNAQVKQIRTDLPVFHVLAGKDGAGLIAGERELWRQAAAAHAPWTMVDAPQLPHAFDAVDPGDESRRVVGLTLAFLDAHLGALPPPPPASTGREVLSYMYGQELGKAVPVLEKMLAAEPGNAGATRVLLLARARSGDCAGAEKLRDKVPPADVGARNALALCAMQAGRLDQAISDFEGAIAAGGRIPVNFYNLACAHARAGHTDAAFKALDGAVEAGWSDGKSIAEDPDLASLRGDPRFEALVGRLAR